MKIDWFDLDQPIVMNMENTYLKNQHPTIYPLYISRLDKFLQWNCLWCDNSQYSNFNTVDYPLPMILLGCCTLKPNLPLHLRCKRQYCNQFKPIDEYLDLLNSRMFILEFRISHNDFLFL